MDIAKWAVITILSIGFGWSLVQYLVASPLNMQAYLVLCIFLVLGLGLALGFGMQGTTRLAAIGVACAGFVAGYLVTTLIFLNQEEQRSLTALKLPPEAQRDHTAVVYFTHGEPPAYSSMPWIETFKEFDADKASFIPVPFRPFFFLKLREEYLRIGGSPHNYIHQEMVRSLQKMYEAEGDHQTRFYLAFLDSDPRPDEVVTRALNEGANRVVLANVFTTISSHTKAGQEMVKALDLEKYNIPICYSEPLWNSETFVEMFAARANQNLEGTDKSKVGVLLVGHGQPDDWDKVYPTQTEQELAFRQAIIKRMVADGYREENIALAWMEFKEPGVKEVTKKLVEKDMEKLFVFATSISASSMHSLYDIPEAVIQAGIPKGVQVVNLGAWDNDPIVIRAIKERADACK